ncbi:hypothetical protein GA0111570_102266 [Raineyella antarctica]|uniref:Uncharacterized protein n=1 Tax=Raineyella antarctica TaxID=1577474 RepID=A0A1G6GH17_9ACTN|nr:hypothetical protein [Raineyella antarctica]SDB80476.1 hypothetical protein GA0111570_102266 [Raineyella antarctica]
MRFFHRDRPGGDDPTAGNPPAPSQEEIDATARDQQRVADTPDSPGLCADCKHPAAVHTPVCNDCLADLGPHNALQVCGAFATVPTPGWHR